MRLVPILLTYLSCSSVALLGGFNQASAAVSPASREASSPVHGYISTAIVTDQANADKSLAPQPFINRPAVAPSNRWSRYLAQAMESTVEGSDGSGMGITSPFNNSGPEPAGETPMGGSIPPGSAAPPASTTIQGGVDRDYLLGPGDVIQVDVFNVPEYSGTFRVSIDGTVNLPTSGRLSVANQTTQQAASAITAAYAAELQSPMVSVSVLEQRPLQISVIGEIAQPGLYTLPASEGPQYPTLFQILQAAGGVTQAADLKSVEIRRRGGLNSSSQVKVDLLALLERGDINQNVYLRDGDTVVIPAASTIEMANLNQLAVSNIRASSDQPVDIAIVGEVTRPGPYRVESGQPTVVQAIQQAGGLTTGANLRQIELRRKTRQGAEQITTVNLWDIIQTGNLDQDLILQTGDVIAVPTARDTTVADITSLASSSLSTGEISVNIIGEVESPGSLQVQANTSLNQAILAAGGLNRRATPQTTLIRFNSNGSVTQQEIAIDLEQEVNSDTNPILQPNDVIVVGRNARAAFTDRFSDWTGVFNLVWPFVLLGL